VVERAYAEDGVEAGWEMAVARAGLLRATMRGGWWTVRGTTRVVWEGWDAVCAASYDNIRR